MTRERRQHQRVVKLFEGRWQGASGSGECRIADLSVGGCFIQTLAMPAVGEKTVVTVRFGEHELVFHGTILYVESGMGFAVQFQNTPKDELSNLARLVAALQEPQG